MGRSSDTRASRVTGIAATAVFHLLVLFACLSIWLRYPRNDSEPPDTLEEDTVITFEDVVDLVAGGTYVEAEFVAPEPEPQLSAGSSVEAAPPLPPEPTQEEIQEKKRKEISNKVTFNTSTTTSDPGNGGDNASTIAATTGEEQPRYIGLNGFSLGHFTRPHGKSTGVIAIAVTVDAEGNVISASFNSTRTTYDVIADPRARQECIDAAYKSKFTPDPGQTSGASGFILYQF